MHIEMYIYSCENIVLDPSDVGLAFCPIKIHEILRPQQHLQYPCIFEAHTQSCFLNTYVTIKWIYVSLWPCKSILMCRTRIYHLKYDIPALICKYTENAKLIHKILCAFFTYLYVSISECLRYINSKYIYYYLSSRTQICHRQTHQSSS